MENLKKTYIISWIGASASCACALIGAKHCVKKYGEKLNTNNFSFVKCLDTVNKGLDLVDKVIK